MAVYLISYDLRKPDFDYDPLYKALDKMAADRIQDSVWGLRTKRTAEEIFDNLWQHMHNAKDRLFVIPIDPDAQYRATNSMKKIRDL